MLRRFILYLYPVYVLLQFDLTFLELLNYFILFLKYFISCFVSYGIAFGAMAIKYYRCQITLVTSVVALLTKVVTEEYVGIYSTGC